MQKAKGYRAIIIVALAALTGLLVVQIYWFVNAYNLQEKQFDERVNLALRSLTDQLLLLEREDSTSRIAPIKQTAANSYYVDFNAHIDYASLDSLLKRTFMKHQLFSPFELTVYEDLSKLITFGNYYHDGIMSDARTTCVTRIIPERTAMDFIVTFPDKKTDVVGAMGIWIFSAFTFLLILILFAFMIMDLSKQKKLAEVKADFINNMTHELQTPIANISLASEVLRKGTNIMDEKKSTHYANIIYGETQRLKFQVDHVLQTAMLERGEVELRRREVNLNSIIEDVVSNFQVRIQNRQGEINCRLEAEPALVYGDKFHLTNIFYSLLDNADKYSPLKPNITITTKNKDNGVLVAIADKGMGIHQDAQQYIFEKFYRAPTGDVHDVKGFGLGLTYVREIVKAHQGIVSVSSEVNRGSLFELYFQNC